MGHMGQLDAVRQCRRPTVGWRRRHDELHHEQPAYDELVGETGGRQRGSYGAFGALGGYLAGGPFWALSGILASGVDVFNDGWDHAEAVIDEVEAREALQEAEESLRLY